MLSSVGLRKRVLGLEIIPAQWLTSVSAAAALAPFHVEPGPYAADAADAVADHALSAAKTKLRQSSTGKGVARHRNEKEGLEVAAALQEEVGARVNGGIAAAEDAYNVSLSSKDANAMYFASMTAASPACLERSKELVHALAATVPRKAKSKPNQRGSESMRRFRALLGLGAQARSATYGALTRWII